MAQSQKETFSKTFDTYEQKPTSYYKENYGGCSYDWPQDDEERVSHTVIGWKIVPTPQAEDARRDLEALSRLVSSDAEKSKIAAALASTSEWYKEHTESD